MKNINVYGMKVGETEEMHSIFDGLSVAIIIVDANAQITYLNEASRRIQGRLNTRFDEGRSLFEGIVPEWSSFALTFFQNLLTEKKPARTEVSFADVSGKQNYFEIYCGVTLTEDGELRSIIVEAHDVTKQKIFETKITSIARELNSLIETANAVIIGTDSRGYITEWNNSTKAVTGYTKNEAYTRKFSDLLLGNTDHPFNNTLAEVLDGGKVDNLELTIRAKSNQWITLLINVTPRRNATGEVVGLLIIGQDITELSEYRKTLEQKVFDRTAALEKALSKEKQLVEMKNRFVSIASHEFKSPLSAIFNQTETINKNLSSLTPEEVTSRLNSIQTHVQHMSALLDDVLTIGKNESSTIQPKLQLLDMRAFLERLIDEISVSTNHTHTIQFDFLAPSAQIRSDEKLLRNIFINLLTNAIKFSPGKNSVFLSVETVGSWIQVTVKDQGIGIPDNDIERVFVPFNRGENVEKIKGTGLGLSIVKRAVEALGGNLTVKSRPGEGTTFKISLKSTT